MCCRQGWCLLSSLLPISLLQSKLKKIKEKYKDQDEEDRELIMKLLGVRQDSNTFPSLPCCERVRGQPQRLANLLGMASLKSL